ncbi:MAG: COG1361 S-layer family protein [Senegalia sp. (in: firmicutes)]
MKRKVVFIGLIFIIMILVSTNTYAVPKSPELVISEYKIEPEMISPGGNFKIKLTLNNYGEYHARKIKLTLKDKVSEEKIPTGELQSEEVEVKLDDFSPLNQSNIKYVSLIKANKKEEVVYDLYASPNMKAGNYNLVVSLDYTDYNGNTYSEDQIIGILLSEKENIKLLGKDNYGDLAIGQPVESTINIVNNSKAEVKGVTVSVEGEGENNYTEYLGNFNSGDFDSYTFDAVFDEDGEKDINVKVSYIDSMNKNTEIEKKLKYNVKSGENIDKSSDKEEEGNVFIRFIKGLFGF